MVLSVLFFSSSRGNPRLQPSG